MSGSELPGPCLRNVDLSPLYATSNLFGKWTASNITVSRILVLYTGGTIGMSNEVGVYKPLPNFLAKALRNLPMFHDRQVKLDVPPEFESNLFVMPLSNEGVRLLFVVNEYQPLLDSSDMTMDMYVRIGQDIRREYANYDGFVILHGTDTMAYTASALSFILENLGKPVIITGSQIPIFEMRSDGRDNFLGALQVAGHHCIPEVTVYFHYKVFRGNRVTKASIHEFEAFESPNYPPIVELSIHMRVHYDRIFKPKEVDCFRVHDYLCPDVAVLRLFPSITLSTVQSFLQPPIKGVVLQTYGSGNMPSKRVDLLEAIAEAGRREVIIVNISQCHHGAVSSLYEAGPLLEKAGVIAGQDMTLEAALTKLAYVLSKPNLTYTERCQLMSTCIRGELTLQHGLDSISSETLLSQLVSSLGLQPSMDMNVLQDKVIPILMCSAAKDADLKALKQLGAIIGHFQVFDYDRRTPLHLAVCEGHVQVVKYLLKRGAFLHSVDRFGGTALMNAIEFQHPEIIKLLLQTGAHLNLSNQQLSLKLLTAAAAGDVATVRMYHLAGANMEVQDLQGQSALHAACTQIQEKVIRFLVSEVRVDCHQRNRYNLTALDELKLSISKRPDSRRISQFLESALITLLVRAMTSSSVDYHSYKRASLTSSCVYRTNSAPELNVMQF